MGSQLSARVPSGPLNWHGPELQGEADYMHRRLVVRDLFGQVCSLEIALA